MLWEISIQYKMRKDWEVYTKTGEVYKVGSSKSVLPKMILINHNFMVD